MSHSQNTLLTLQAIAKGQAALGAAALTVFANPTSGQYIAFLDFHNCWLHNVNTMTVFFLRKPTVCFKKQIYMMLDQEKLFRCENLCVSWRY